MKRILFTALSLVICTFLNEMNFDIAYAREHTLAVDYVPFQMKSRKILEIPPHSEGDSFSAVRWIGWSPDGEKLAVVYEDESTIYILDADSGKVKFSLDFPEPTVKSSFAWSPDSNYLAASLSGNPGLIKIWPVNETPTKPAKIIERTGSDTKSFYWSPDSLKIVYVDYSLKLETSILSIWDVKKGSVLASKEGMAMGIWSPDGKKMAVYGNDENGISSLLVVDSSNFKILSKFTGYTTDKKPHGYVLWNNDHALTGMNCGYSGECSLWLWNIQTNKIRTGFELPDKGYIAPNWVETTFALGGSGKYISLAHYETVDFWDVDTGKFLGHLQFQAEVKTLAWHPTKNNVAIPDSDGSIGIWEIESDE